MIFAIICDPSETGRSLGAIGDSIHEIGCFCGYEEQNDATAHKIGPFYGYEVAGIEIIAKKKLGGQPSLFLCLLQAKQFTC